MADPYRPEVPPRPVGFRRPIAEEDAEFDKMCRKIDQRQERYAVSRRIWRPFFVVLAVAVLFLLALASRSCARPCQSTVLPERRVLCICPEAHNDHVTILEEGTPCKR